MAKIKAIFYIPICDNDGRNLDDEIDELEFDLYAEFIAWTKNGMIAGTYQMPDGSRSDDVHMVYSIFMDESRLKDLENILLAFKAKTTQESIYLEIQRNVEVRLIGR
ncbi:MAG: hypothetical protein FJ303_00545 [Planctomycetes bacterium]|nr:hypothetical protein [Planctomycetota bacterium]